MSKEPPIHYIDTKAASVKMTGGVPFRVIRVGDYLGSDSESEDENHPGKDTNTSRSRSISGTQSTPRKNDTSIVDGNNFRGQTDPPLRNSKNLQPNVAVSESSQNDSPSHTHQLMPSGNTQISSQIRDMDSQNINSLSNSCSSPDISSSKSQVQKILDRPNSGNIFDKQVPEDIPAHLVINTDNNYRYTNSRFNPFNQIPVMDEDHFSDSYFHPQSMISHGSSSPRSSFQHIDGVLQSGSNKSDVSFAELGLAEDHFSHPQGHFGLSGVEELELAIDNCKDMIREAEQGSEKQKNLVMKLVQLRIKLQEIKDGPEQVADDVKVILSHKMIPKSSRTSKYYCERCNGVIWGMLQYWYRCSECGYRCHEKCLQQILRTCAKAKVSENQPLFMEICPKETNDLAYQTYRCAECKSAVSFKTGQSEPRLCDYSGRYFCEYCHWNDSVIIPARVLHNWDFNPRKVSRSSKQFLKLMQQKAVIRIQDINPMLFVYVDQLNEIKKLREEMMVMKKYIVSCPSAMEAKLLLLLEKRQHFVESSDRYSMQDLLDAEEILLPELVSIHSTWAQHVKVDCELCQGRGFCCELCNDKDILFPFDNIAVVCAKCSNVLHRHCFAKKSICPRCERRERRTAPQ